jgi:hypothetical protein
MFRDPDGNALMLWEHAVVRVEDVASEESALRYQLSFVSERERRA